MRLKRWLRSRSNYTPFGHLLKAVWSCQYLENVSKWKKCKGTKTPRGPVQHLTFSDGRLCVFVYFPSLAVIFPTTKHINPRVDIWHIPTCRNICTSTFPAIIMTELWNQPTCPWTNTYIRKMWYVYTTEFYYVFLKFILFSYITPWLNYPSTPPSSPLTLPSPPDIFLSFPSEKSNPPSNSNWTQNNKLK